MRRTTVIQRPFCLINQLSTLTGFRYHAIMNTSQENAIKIRGHPSRSIYSMELTTGQHAAVWPACHHYCGYLFYFILMNDDEYFSRRRHEKILGNIVTSTTLCVALTLLQLILNYSIPLFLVFQAFNQAINQSVSQSVDVIKSKKDKKRPLTSH